MADQPKDALPSSDRSGTVERGRDTGVGEFEVRLSFVPPALKNDNAIARRKDGTPFIAHNPKQKKAKKRINEIARALLPEGLMFEDDELFVTIDWIVALDEVRVSVKSLGPRPKGRTGRQKDVQNIPAIILDALEGVVYRNDNQVKCLVVRRV